MSRALNKAEIFVNRETNNFSLVRSRKIRMYSLNLETFPALSFIYIFIVARLWFSQKNFIFFFAEEENSRMKNIFQMTGLVFVCVYTTRDAFLLPRTGTEKKNIKDLKIFINPRKTQIFSQCELGETKLINYHTQSYIN